MRQSYRWLLALCLALALSVPGCSSPDSAVMPDAPAPAAVVADPAPAVVAEPAPVIEAPAVTEPAPVQQAPAAKQAPVAKVVYGTKTGEKYHTEGCQYLKRSKIAMSVEDARSSGLDACSVCNP